MSIARDYTESGRQSWHVAESLATRRSNYSNPCAKLAVFLATNGQFLCVIQRSPSRIQSAAAGEGGQRVRLGPAHQLLMQSVVAISLRRDEPSSPDAKMWLESICRSTVHPLGSSRRSEMATLLRPEAALGTSLHVATTRSRRPKIRGNERRRA